MNADELARILDELGERLGPTGQYLMDLTVRQIVAEAMAWIIGGAVVVLILWAITVIAFRVADLDDPADDLVAWAFLSGLVSLFVSAVFVPVLALNIIRLGNPEYAAIERIIGMVVPS